MSEDADYPYYENEGLRKRYKVFILFWAFATVFLIGVLVGGLVFPSQIITHTTKDKLQVYSFTFQAEFFYSDDIPIIRGYSFDLGSGGEVDGSIRLNDSFDLTKIQMCVLMVMSNLGVIVSDQLTYFSSNNNFTLSFWGWFNAFTYYDTSLPYSNDNMFVIFSV